LGDPGGHEGLVVFLVIKYFVAGSLEDGLCLLPNVPKNYTFRRHALYFKIRFINDLENKGIYKKLNILSSNLNRRKAEGAPSRSLLPHISWDKRGGLMRGSD